MDNQTTETTTPAPNQPLKAAPAAPGTTDVESLTELAKERWQSWLVSAAVVVVVIGGIVLYRTHKATSEATANRMLGQARNPQALVAIRTQYPGTSAAKLALLEIAKAQYDSGDYITSVSSYSDFITQNPKHPLLPVAELGKIHCSEAMGQTAQALSAYQAFAAKYPESFTRPMALFGQARCLAQLRRFDESRAVYEDFLAANPKTPWKGEIEEALKQISRESRKPAAGM